MAGYYTGQYNLLPRTTEIAVTPLRPMPLEPLAPATTIVPVAIAPTQDLTPLDPTVPQTPGGEYISWQPPRITAVPDPIVNTRPGALIPSAGGATGVASGGGGSTQAPTATPATTPQIPNQAQSAILAFNQAQVWNQAYRTINNGGVASQSYQAPTVNALAAPIAPTVSTPPANFQGPPAPTPQPMSLALLAGIVIFAAVAFKVRLV